MHVMLLLCTYMQTAVAGTSAANLFAGSGYEDKVSVCVCEVAWLWLECAQVLTHHMFLDLAVRT